MQGESFSVYLLLNKANGILETFNESGCKFFKC